jgi:hypothetical protein
MLDITTVLTNGAGWFGSGWALFNILKAIRVKRHTNGNGSAITEQFWKTTVNSTLDHYNRRLLDLEEFQRQMTDR